MSVYIIHVPYAPTFKFGIASDFLNRVSVYRTCHAVFSYYVFPCASPPKVEKLLQKELKARGALLAHMGSDRLSECASVGENEEHLWFAMQFIASTSKSTGLPIVDAPAREEQAAVPSDVETEEERNPIITAASTGTHTDIARAALHVITDEFAYVDGGKSAAWYKRNEEKPWFSCPNAEMQMDQLLSTTVSAAFQDEAVKNKGHSEGLRKIVNMLRTRNVKRHIILQEIRTLCYIEKDAFVNSEAEPEPETDIRNDVFRFLSLSEDERIIDGKKVEFAREHSSPKRFRRAFQEMGSSTGRGRR